MFFLGETISSNAVPRRGAVALTTTAHGSIVPVDEDKEEEGQKRPTVDNEDADDGGEDGQADNRLEDQMNNEHLKLLQNIFEEADEDSGGGLDMDEFRNAMRRTMGAGVPDHELDMLFMKVDTNCDGGVDWDEYLTYMLLEYQEREMMAQLLKERPLPSNVRKIETRHRDLLQKLCFLPSSRTSIDLAAGRYATMSKDGTVNFWTLELAHRGTSRLEPFDKERSQSLWITDMVCINNHNMLALSTTESDLYFVDIGAGKFDKVFMLVGLPQPLLCMDYWCDAANSDKAYLILGDAGGGVIALIFTDIPGAVGLFGIPSSKDGMVMKITIDDIFKKKLPSVEAKSYRPLHKEWVKQVKYVPELAGFISCALSNEVSMAIVETAGNKANYIFSTRRGITCFDYDNVQGVIVTGGMDCTVRVWNTYMTNRPSMLFIGHNAPISHILARPADEQIISLSKDKCVKVWDLREQVCVQTVSPQRLHVNVSLPFFTAMFYNPKIQQLVLASQIMVVLQKNMVVQAGEREIQSHERVVTAAIYNHLFNKVVSGCHGSVITVWELTTGQKVMQFRNAHTTRRNGQSVPVEITCMTFDPTLRRLITGGRDGRVKIWNFNNGACLRQMEAGGGREVTGVLVAKQRIVCCGWNRGITVFLDDREDTSVREWMKRHKEDILTVDFRSPSLVATGAYDGEIIVWNLETGHLYSRLSVDMVNAGRSMVPEVEDKQRLGAMTKYKEKQKNMVLNFTKRELMGTASKVEERSQTASQPVEGEDNEPTWLHESSSDEDNAKDTAESAASEAAPESSDRSFERAIHKLLFLQSRISSASTATLLASCADGTVQAWSLHHEGGLLHKFRACNSVGDYCLTMVSDSRNRYLVTGDTAGYVRVWLIENYCTDHPEPVNWAFYKKKFPLLGKHLSMMRRMLKLDWLKASFRPHILNSFRAHVRTVMSVDFVEAHELLVTASADCSVRLWTLCGRFIGIFGQKKFWNLTLPLKLREIPIRIPRDVHRVASSTTLKVMHGGKHPKWHLVQMGILLAASELMRGQAELKERSRRMREARLRASQAMDGSTLNLDDKIGTRRPAPILGENYERKSRHKPIPTVPKPKIMRNQVMAFTLLPFVDVEDVPEPEPPAIVHELTSGKQESAQRSARSSARGRSAGSGGQRLSIAQPR
ncbi:WD repeat-containing protein on Y chromosome-like isoform X1 [Amphibalanus amphitrite]|uniref:WD repeat-containing protein on Y chromosome-like isoform X1 n=1 Tax=Amphibalanus amphitrite TaxID=1232801 RepID=UPI001C907EAD|nr:WD repeat-containing protein on Y chromosome-like isoform X1 [Amphibalanus amphitrite]